MMANKPPLGVMPRFIWLEKRRDEVAEAITRFQDEGWALSNASLVSEWFDEIRWLDEQIDADKQRRHGTKGEL